VIALTVLALGLLGDAVRDVSTQRWSQSRLIAPAAGRRAKAAATPAADAPGSSRALLSVRGLVVEFTDRAAAVRVVSDVSFDIMPGETLGVVGESGCGKTMTAMGVLGLLPAGSRIGAGTVVFDGQDLRGLDAQGWARVRGKGIGYISQEPMIALDPTFTVGAQIAEAVRRHHRTGRQAARDRALRLLEQVNLPDTAQVYRRYPHQLSGGIAQRVAIALALAGEPRLLIADEPTTALDVSVQAEILALLHTLQRDTGLAVLLVTHDFGVVADLCERAVVMYAGQVVESGDVRDIFAMPRHPYTVALLAANLQSAAARSSAPRIGIRPEPLPTIAGTVPRPQDWPVGCHFQDRCGHARTACRAWPIDTVQLADGRLVRCVRVTELNARKGASR
jgi:peptide/nickel transport system permease protein